MRGRPAESSAHSYTCQAPTKSTNSAPASQTPLAAATPPPRCSTLARPPRTHHCSPPSPPALTPQPVHLAVPLTGWSRERVLAGRATEAAAAQLDCLSRWLVRVREVIRRSRMKIIIAGSVSISYIAMTIAAAVDPRNTVDHLRR